MFVMGARAILGRSHSRPRRRFYSGEGCKRIDAPQEAAPSVAPRRRASVASSRSRRMGAEPRSSCRVCQNGRRGPRTIRRNARSARARSRAAAATICRRFPRRACDSRKLQSALPVQKPPPVNSVGDRVTNCLHSFARNGGRATNRTNGDFYVRSCVNNRPDKPKTLERQAIFGDPLPSIFASIFAARRHLLATVLGSVRPAERGIFRTGEAAMAKVLNEILLFSSMAVFVTGIVLAAARLLI